jgi:hypothetical protein
VVVGFALLSGCASAPLAAPPDLVDISQVPGLDTTLYVSEFSSGTIAPKPAPSADELALAAMQKQTEGMAPGAVAGGLKEPIVIHLPEANAPASAVLPPLVVPALQPAPNSLPPQEEKSWKMPLPPLKSLGN